MSIYLGVRNEVGHTEGFYSWEVNQFLYLMWGCCHCMAGWLPGGRGGGGGGGGKERREREKREKGEREGEKGQGKEGEEEECNKTECYSVGR